MLKVGEQVKFKGFCPFVWEVYGHWPYGPEESVHLQRWDAERSIFLKETFVDPDLLVKV